MGWFTSPHLNTWQDTQEITKTAQLGVLDAHENNSFIFAQWDGHNFNLTVNGSFAPESGAGEVKAGTFRTIHAGERDGYTFAGWTATPWASFQNANNPTTGVFMPGSDVTVTANWTSTGPVGTVINIAAIGGVTAPVAGQVPVTVITETDQFTGTVTWNGSPASFAHGTAYTATITLTPKTGFTLNGVAADFFTVSGATTVSNPANSGVVTAVFPSTAAQTYLVTVSSTGTGATSGGNFEQGATVSISAGTPPNGYQFVNWTASPAVSFADDTNPSTTFNMIGQAVTVTANFEPIPPTVTGVTVYPQTVEVEIGEKFQFSATVQGTNNPSQTVTWGVEGGDGSSSINETGELTVGPTEADGVELTVTATSTANTGVYGTATVTVTDTPPTVTVDSVTVTPPTITLDRGGYHTFSATVYGTNAPQGVTWSLNNTAGGSSINANGDLTIGANETATALTVTATSTHTASVYGTATVTVLQPVVNAQTPYITAQPQGAVYTQNDNAVPLTVTASVTDGGLLSYQWYSNTVNSTSDGTPVGTSGASFTPPTTEAGTLYYFVVITNTNDNVNGTLTAAVTSNVVAVTVNEMIVPIVYAVTYNANGGTGTMTAGSVNQGADFTIAANTFTRAGHTFAGWNTQAGGNGTAYAAGATINNVMAAITLYAQWTADPEPSPSPEPPPTSPPPPPPEPTPTPTPAPTPTTEPTPAPTPTPPPAEVTISDDAIEAITEAAEITTNQITGAVTVEIELTEEITEAIEAAVEAALEAVLDLNTYLAAAREAREAAVEAGEEYEETDAPEFITVVLNITEMFADLVDDIDTLTTVSLPVQMFETIAEAEEIGLELAMPAGTITFNPAAMASTVASAGLSQCTHISATMETLQMHDVPVEQRRNVSGSETIVRVAFMAGEEPIRNFDGYISVTVPYPGPFPAAVWMLTDNGELRRMPATYCEESQTVTFRSNSFSLFIIDAAPAATEAVYARGLLMSFTLGSPFFTLRGVMYESEVAPYAAAGRTMVPLRVIVEALGSEIEWVRATQSVIIRHEGRTLELFLDVPLYDDNGIYMGTPIAINGRTLVPLRYVMEVLLDDPDAVDWDRTNQQINIFEMIFKEEEE
ncbi:MAG: stalk domain-containing protein [Defluviitaleaceae bacterium]|nr:stalk domain-containing protein [Defluviitaleaceae bacterium]